MKACVRVLQCSKQIQSFDVLFGSTWKTHSALPLRRLTSRSSPTTVFSASEETQMKHATELKDEANKRKHDDEINQDLFLDVLESAATKREATAYLSRFGAQRTDLLTSKPTCPKVKSVGVNLGRLYLPVRSVDENPVFSHTPFKSCLADKAIETLHIALVKIRGSQSIDDSILHRVAHTLSQLARLGMYCIVVVDPEDGQQEQAWERGRIAVEQADRLVEVIRTYSYQGARRLDSIIGVAPTSEQLLASVKVGGRVRINDRGILLAPLRRGVVPVIPPIGFTADTQKLVAVDADEVMLGLTQDFTGLQTKISYDDDAARVAEKIRSLQKQISLDRIIVLDPLGGIPATHRLPGSHVFINLEQEFESIKRDLLGLGSTHPEPSSQCSNCCHDFTSSSPSSNPITIGSANVGQHGQKHDNAARSDLRLSNTDFHLKNLELMRNTLAVLPPSSSGLLIKPDNVAKSESDLPLTSQGPSVRTRKQKNPLIHNLLTDKPVYSSSLPADRSPSMTPKALTPVVASVPATFFKRGMPLALIPDPLAKAWAAPSPSDPSISMLDPRIDLPRLVHLVEDSFSRKLDVPHYLNRIKDRIAGIIIAGEYEGGAILTWETPPGYPADDPNYMVPYLDKFAVLKRCQGSGGVSDIVFNAMVRGCFPEGLCWRSRKDNPINKWYFERASGVYKIPNSNWTMFWTTKGIMPGDRLFLHYEAVCKAVEPSWADKKNVID